MRELVHLPWHQTARRSPGLLFPVIGKGVIRGKWQLLGMFCLFTGRNCKCNGVFSLPADQEVPPASGAQPAGESPPVCMALASLANNHEAIPDLCKEAAQQGWSLGCSHAAGAKHSQEKRLGSLLCVADHLAIAKYVQSYLVKSLKEMTF